MSWINELVNELRCRQEELSRKDTLRLLRKTVFEEEGPRVFAELKSKIRAGVEALRKESTDLESLVVNDASARGNCFEVRNLYLQPSVVVLVDLNRADILVRVESAPTVSESRSEVSHSRIDFTLDQGDHIALCLKCELINVEEVAKLILRPAMGL